MPLYRIFCANSEKPPSYEVIDFIYASMKGTVSGCVDSEAFVIETDVPMPKGVRNDVLSKGCGIKIDFRADLKPIKLVMSS